MNKCTIVFFHPTTLKSVAFAHGCDRFFGPRVVSSRTGTLLPTNTEQGVVPNFEVFSEISGRERASRKYNVGASRLSCFRENEHTHPVRTNSYALLVRHPGVAPLSQSMQYCRRAPGMVLGDGKYGHDCIIHLLVCCSRFYPGYTRVW